MTLSSVKSRELMTQLGFASDTLKLNKLSENFIYQTFKRDAANRKGYCHDFISFRTETVTFY